MNTPLVGLDKSLVSRFGRLIQGAFSYALIVKRWELVALQKAL